MRGTVLGAPAGIDLPVASSRTLAELLTQPSGLNKLLAEIDSGQSKGCCAPLSHPHPSPAHPCTHGAKANNWLHTTPTCSPRASSYNDVHNTELCQYAARPCLSHSVYFSPEGPTRHHPPLKITLFGCSGGYLPSPARRSSTTGHSTGSPFACSRQRPTSSPTLDAPVDSRLPVPPLSESLGWKIWPGVDSFQRPIFRTHLLGDQRQRAETLTQRSGLSKTVGEQLL